MLACGRCGTANPDTARFCQACGASLATDSSPNRERKLVTVVFVDVVGSTALGDAADPEDLKEALARVFKPVREQAELHGGTIEKFIGDAAVVVFGAPVAHGDDSERAVRCALGIVEAVAADSGRKATVRAGVSTGEAVVALGSAYERGEALATGDVMNTAARLQAAAPPGRVAVGAVTYAATRRRILYQPLPPLELRGKAEPVAAWLAVRPIDPAERASAGTPMVGRQAELDQLLASLAATVAEGRPRFVTVLGEAGIGKSRLGSEFGRRAEADGARRVVGRCLPFDRGGGYPASVRQVESLAGVLETDVSGVAAEKLRLLVAEHLPPVEVADVTRYLSLLLGLGVEPPASARQPLFFALRRLFECLAAEQPLLLVVEDLPWAGPSQRELLDYLRAQLREVPVFQLALSRPGGVEGETIELEPLGPEDSAAILQGVLGTGGASQVERLVEAAGGNPLFLEELATSPAGAGAGALPATVREAIAARIDALPAMPRALLLDASVVGQSFWRGALADIEGSPDIDAGLVALIEADLVRQLARSRVAGDTEYAFKHVLIRDVAYDTLPRAVRKTRHLAVARHMERAAGSAGRDLAAILAHHWRNGGEIGRAIDNLLIAAERACDAWAQKECEAHFAEAEELAGGDGPQRTQIRLRLGEALVQLSDFDAGATVLDEVLPKLEGRQLVEALIARARVAYWLEETEETKRFSDRSRELAESLGEEELVAAATVYQVASRYSDDLAEATSLGEEAHRRWVRGARPMDFAALEEFRADVAYWAGEYPTAEEHARRAHELGGEVHSIEPVLRSGGWRGLTMAAQGRSEEAIEWLDAIIARAHQLDSKWGAASFNYSSLAFRDMLFFEEARRRNRMSLELVSSRGAYGMPEMQAEIDLMLADLAERNPGPVQAALPALWQQAINGRAWRPWLGGGRLALVRAELARQVDGAAEAATAAADAIERARRNGRVKYEAAAREILGASLVELGRREEGVAELFEAVRLADLLGSPTARWQFRASLAAALLRTGADTVAERTYTEAAGVIRTYASSLSPTHAAHFLAAEPVRDILRAR